MVGWQQLINRCDNDSWYGAAALTVEFDSSFKPNAIARSLFSNDVTCDCDSATITISGSRSPDRGAQDWLADYFSLPTDFKSTISFKPWIRNSIADFSFYYGFKICDQNLYFRFNAPLVHTRWNLNFYECVIDAGSNGTTAGYYIPQICSDSRAHLLANATEFFCGQKANLATMSSLKTAKWSCGCEQTSKTNLAALNMALGWNFLCCDTYRFGLNIRASAPTGDRPRGILFFEPITGNGHH
jgi:hypothetical protein